MQGPNTTYGEHEPDCSENCLVLNVWTPSTSDHGKRPVMFYCHGGGFETGSGGHRIHDGAHLAARYDVVVVESNHRLGLFGYLWLGELGGADYSGNQGMLDIVDALSWVKENIAGFGGDPGNVFVFGESGGGAKTSTLMAMPAAQGLFHKAGIQSGAMLKATPRDAATETARRLLAGLDIAPKDIAKLHDVPAAQLMAIQLAGAGGKGPLSVATKEWLAANPVPPQGIAAMRDQTAGELGAGGGWRHVAERPVRSRSACAVREHAAPDRQHAGGGDLLRTRRSVLLPDGRGGAERAPAPIFRRHGGQHSGVLSPRHAGRLAGGTRHRARDRDVQRQRHGHAGRSQGAAGRVGLSLHQRLSVERAGQGHGLDAAAPATRPTLRLTFDNSDIPDLQGNGPGLTEASKAMSGYFAAFARNGVPTADAQPPWPRYDASTREVMLLNNQCRAAQDPNADECRFWQSLGW